MMSPATKLLQDAGFLHLALEGLQDPLDAIVLADDDFGQRASLVKCEWRC